jgi:hypothetical protein
VITRSPLRGLAAVALITLGVAATAAAQPPIETQQRPYNGLFGGGPPQDPNRTRTELSLNGSIFGGYDDNLVAAAPGLGGPGTGGDNAGNLIQGTLGMRYYRGRPVRNVSIDGNAYVVDYGDAGVGLTKGGSLGFSASTRLGRADRDQFRFDQRVSYDPLFSFGPTAAIGPVVDVDTLPQTEPALGIFERASWGSTTSLAYNRALGRRSSLDLNYDFEAREYETSPDPTATLGDSTSHRASFDLRRSLSRTWSTRAEYMLFYARPTDSDGIRPLTDHNILAGIDWTRRVSRTRTLHVSASGGAHNVRSTLGIGVERTPFDYWAPSGQATVGLDLGRNWNVSADYRRVVTVIPELTTESFLTDAVLVNARGLIGSRLELMLSAGRDWSDAADAGSAATADNTHVGVQAQIALTRMLAATVTYTLFDYQFDEVADLPAGFAQQSRRNAVRVGLSLWLPILGRYQEGRGAAAPAGRP